MGGPSADDGGIGARLGQSAREYWQKKYGKSPKESLEDTLASPGGILNRSGVMTPQSLAAEREASRQGHTESSPETISLDPGDPGSEEAGQDTTSGDLTSTAMQGSFYPPASGGPEKVIAPEGYKPNVVGGEDLLKDAFVTSPQNTEEALLAQGNTEAAAAQAKADFYAKEQKRQAEKNAELQAERQRNYLAIQAQQAELQKKTTAYTNDLADTGRWWRNPGNVISAFAAALMTLGTDDHAIGFKLINNAITQDFNQRRDLANMHLGELRSNLASFRQIAGDKDRGDELALAENNRIAAMELERIAQTGMGPIAKAKALTLAAEFHMQARQRMAQVMANIYSAPQAMQPGILKAFKESGGLVPYGDGKLPNGQQSSQNGPGSVSGPGASMTPGTNQNASGANVTPSGGYSEEGVWWPSWLSPKVRAEAERRAPGSVAQYRAAMDDLYKRATYESGGDTNKFKHLMAEYHAKTDADYEKIATRMQGNGATMSIPVKVSGFRRLQADVHNVEKIAESIGESPDEFLGKGAEAIFGGNLTKLWNDKLDALARSDPSHSNEYERRKQALNDAAARFKNALAGKMVDYFHTNIGGNQSKQELENIHMVISPKSTMREIKNFIDNQSRDAQAEYKTALSGTWNPAPRILWQISQGMDSPNLDRTRIEASVKNEKVPEGAVKGHTRRDENVKRAIRTITLPPRPPEGD